MTLNERFEQWAKTRKIHLHKNPSRMLNYVNYTMRDAQVAWEAFQAGFNAVPLPSAVSVTAVPLSPRDEAGLRVPRIPYLRCQMTWGVGAESDGRRCKLARGHEGAHDVS